MGGLPENLSKLKHCEEIPALLDFQSYRKQLDYFSSVIVFHTHFIYIYIYSDCKYFNLPLFVFEYGKNREVLKTAL